VALDYIPDVLKLNEVFQKAGLLGASVVEADFTRWNTGERFEVVLSLGFIEHFTNWKPVLRKHWDILAVNGTLLLGVPILGLAQMWLRRRVYTADQTSNTVSVFDPSTNRMLGVIPLGIPTPQNLSPLYRGQLLVHD